MAKQDDFVRITVRIPPELYERLRSSARATSINAEIVERLSSTLKTKDEKEVEDAGAALRRIERRMSEVQQMMLAMKDQQEGLARAAEAARKRLEKPTGAR